MNKELEDILLQVKNLASRYKSLTGKPLGVTGEIAEFNAAKLLGLTLAEARTPGYDAIDRNGRKVQIKGRCLSATPKPGQRLGSIRLDHDWDMVLLVLMSENFEVLEIWQAERHPIEKALLAPGSIARTERGALAVNKFKQIGSKIWPLNN